MCPVIMSMIKKRHFANSADAEFTVQGRVSALKNVKFNLKKELEVEVMIVGELKNQIDKIWDDMYSYGIANPLVVIEQLTYLFFIRSLDDIETANEKKDAMLGGEPTERIFPQDEIGQTLRWSKF